MKKINMFSGMHLIASCFFIGYFPLGPGTITSLIAMLVHYFLPEFSILTSIIILNVLFFIGTLACEKMALTTTTKDASFIVIDEWFGMWLALFLIPRIFWLYIVAFVLFRIFDIAKPKPISSLEKHAPGGLGIILDDTAAGFFTFVIVQIIALFL